MPVHRTLPVLGTLVTLGIVVTLGFVTFPAGRWGESGGPPQQALPGGPVPKSTGGTPGPAPDRAPTVGTVPARPGTEGPDAGPGTGEPRGPRTGGPAGTGSGPATPGGPQTPHPEAPSAAEPPPAPTGDPEPTTDPEPSTEPGPVTGSPVPPTEEARVVELALDGGVHSVDIDYWRAEHEGGGDLNATATGLVTAGGAKLAVVRDGRADLATCGGERGDWADEVLYTSLGPGTYLCARSSGGRSAYLRIEAVPTATYRAITFYGHTWDDPG